MKNPFLGFVVFGFCVLVLYSIGLSDLYPQLTLSTILFLLVMLSINTLFFLLTNNKICRLSRDIRLIQVRDVPIYVIVGLSILITIDFLYAGSIPAFDVFRESFNRRIKVEFIPVLHIALVVISIFLSQYSIHLYFLRKRRLYIYIVICFGVIYPLLLAGRGILFVNILAGIIAILFHVDIKLKASKLLKYLVLLFFLSYSFGKLGEVRSTNIRLGSSFDSDTNVIEQISQPSDLYYSLGLNHNLLWPYIYIISPLGNFDNMVNDEINFDSDVAYYISSNFVPEFLHKYIGTVREKDKSNLVVDYFNTYTAFGMPYQQLGWIGVYIYSIFTSLLFYFLISISSCRLSSIIMVQFISVGHVFSWFSNLYIKEIVVGPILIGFFILFISSITKSIKRE
ncbi:oligosaccharide repeat unit polymerase [Vibrio sp. F13]|uniref:O-antigen polymerase n=1 Tax=Vibrio sp. F13 TaxID=2070777 RepID=UPI0010BCF9B5|nr:O-antigen polymerase [Vibrio sp. F13]TKF69495.1 oligosaccharide repeat unit polymerase [Vibrio sp. F13]